jgi:hypothetical protein
MEQYDQWAAEWEGTEEEEPSPQTQLTRTRANGTKTKTVIRDTGADSGLVIHHDP